MGKASSSKKVARAARAAGKPGAGRQWGWPLAIAAMVVVGGLLIVVSRGNNEASAPPLIGDHWHSAYGVYACDSFLPPFGETMGTEPNLHSHSDGLIHIEPISTAYTGERATFGAFLEGVGAELADGEYSAQGSTFSEGPEACDGEPATLQLMVWDSAADEQGTLVEGDPAAYRLEDGQLLTLALVPDGADVPKPPDEAIAGLRQSPGPTVLDPDASTSTTAAGEGGGSTTFPSEDPATSDTTTPSGTTDSTAPTETSDTTATP